MQRLKTLRHPAIVRFQWCQDEEVPPRRRRSHATGRPDAGAPQRYNTVVTEPVRPLAPRLEAATMDEVCFGLHRILSGLEFLHAQCGVQHNDLHLGAVFVGEEDGGWRLGLLEHTHPPAAMDAKYLAATADLRDEASAAPEDAALAGAAAGPVGARDVYGFGALVADVLDACPALQQGGGARALRELAASAQAEDPADRPTAAKLGRAAVFRGQPLVEAAEFIRGVAAARPARRAAGFRKLQRQLTELGPEVVARHLVGPLLSRVVLAEPTAQPVLEALLTPAEAGADGILPSPLFRRAMVPHIQRLFALHEIGVRLLLLRTLPHFAGELDEKTLRGTILPEVRLGLSDVDDELVEATLHALGAMVKRVRLAPIDGSPRSRLFSNAIPATAAATRATSPRGLGPGGAAGSTSRGLRGVRKVPSPEVVEALRDGVGPDELSRGGGSSASEEDADGWDGGWDGESPAATEVEEGIVAAPSEVGGRVLPAPEGGEGPARPPSPTEADKAASDESDWDAEWNAPPAEEPTSDVAADPLASAEGAEEEGGEPEDDATSAAKPATVVTSRPKRGLKLSGRAKKSAGPRKDGDEAGQPRQAPGAAAAPFVAEEKRIAKVNAAPARKPQGDALLDGDVQGEDATDEIDYFADMAPSPAGAKATSPPPARSALLAVAAEDVELGGDDAVAGGGDGWGSEEDGWGDD